MRKTHRRQVVVPKRRYLVNDAITAPECRLLMEDGEHIGVVPIAEALAKAKELELDLVEIEPTGTPPVCKIIDYGRFQYQNEKDQQKQRLKQKKTEVKGIRLSLRIGQHDLEVRLAQAKKFLEANDKVKLELVLRGRERQHVPLARKILEQFIETLKEQEVPITTDEAISLQGGRMSVTLGIKK